jgi:hypothetical protein
MYSTLPQPFASAGLDFKLLQLQKFISILNIEMMGRLGLFIFMIQNHV